MQKSGLARNKNLALTFQFVGSFFLQLGRVLGALSHVLYVYSFACLRSSDVNGFTNAAAAWMQKSGLAREKISLSLFSSFCVGVRVGSKKASRYLS